jgi:hypothetical protein
MRIIGCDLHARQQTIAMLDSDTGELEEKTLEHEGDTVREFRSRGRRCPLGFLWRYSPQASRCRAGFVRAQHSLRKKKKSEDCGRVAFAHSSSRVLRARMLGLRNFTAIDFATNHSVTKLVVLPVARPDKSRYRALRQGVQTAPSFFCA